jgi:hypothetical protein
VEGAVSNIAPPLAFTAQQLFDKVINLTLYKADGTSDQILTPAPEFLQGRKPTIRLKGRLVSQDTLLQVELRVTNLYIKSPLSDYKKVDVQAGYRSAPLVAFSGSILVAYQELPGPDGVTMFQLLLGDLSIWRDTFFNGTFAAGQMLSDACREIVTLLSTATFQMKLEYNVTPDVPLKVDIPFTGFAKDLLHEFKNNFAENDPDTGEDIGIQFALLGDTLYVYRSNAGLVDSLIYRLDFISHAKHNSAGFEIIAPWIPALRPGHLIWIDPKYFRQDFGGSQVAIGNQYRIYMIDFSFCTTDSENTMTLLTVGAQ